jgi:hypothetical protein
MLYKIKKFLFPALISISRHLDYEVFNTKVYGTFLKFKDDEIWGVRKVCIEKLSSLIKCLKVEEFDKMKECVEFFKKSLVDTNKWVKTQALI